jgi:hypothetical protein
VRWGQGTPWAGALDATTLGTRFVGLAIRGGYRGCALPVAWVILPAHQPHAWRGREWLRLRRRLGRVGPRPGTVIVLAERGLSAPWLLRRIMQRGWPPCLRINTGGPFRPAGPPCVRPLATFAPQPGTHWQGRGTAFARKPRRLDGTWLACWEAGDKDPWWRLTDLAPEASEAGWYGMRAWMEQGGKLPHRAGGPWPPTRMTDPARAARLWLAVAVATLWVVSMGGAVDATIPAGTLPDVTGLCPAYRRPRRATQWRLVSVLRRGWRMRMGALLRHDPLPEGHSRSTPWPALRRLDEDRRFPEAPARPTAASGAACQEERGGHKECTSVHNTYGYKKACPYEGTEPGGARRQAG